MSQSGTVGMDRYWNYIATPLFFTVISFGVFALFTAKDIQVIDDATMRSTVNEFKQAFASDSEEAKPAPAKPLAKPVAPVAPMAAAKPAAKPMGKPMGKPAGKPAGKPMGKPSSVARGSP
jgi:hypothetical protein